MAATPAQPDAEGPGTAPVRIESRRHLAVVPDAASIDRWHTLVEDHLAAYAGNTLLAYRADIERWQAWCLARGRDPMLAMQSDIEEYRDALEGSEATRRRRIGALASLYNQAAARGAIAESPAREIRRPARAKRQRQIPGQQVLAIEAVALGDTTAADTAAAVDSALVLLLTRAGLRLSEACALHAGDLSVTNAGTTTVTTARGTVELDRETTDAVLAALGAACSGPVLRRRNGEPFTRHDARRLLRRLVEAAGLPALVTADDLRRRR